MINIKSAYASEEEIKNKISPFLGGDDPIFGMHFPLGAEYLFDAKKLSELRIKASIKRGVASKRANYHLWSGCIADRIIR